MVLSPAAAAQVNRILAGQPPSPGKASLNEAIDFINANPGLRARVEGAAPTGLAESRREAFRQQQIQQEGLSARQQKEFAARSRIAEKVTIQDRSRLKVGQILEETPGVFVTRDPGGGFAFGTKRRIEGIAQRFAPPVPKTRQERITAFEAEKSKFIPPEQTFKEKIGRGESRADIGFFEKRVVGEKEGIPQTKIFFVTKSGFVEEATPEESKFVREQEIGVREVPESEQKTIIQSKIGAAFEEFREEGVEAIVEPIQEIREVARVKIEKARERTRESTKFLIDQGLPPEIARSGEFLAGVGLGAAQQVTDEPVETALLFGTGGAVGGVIKGAKIVLRKPGAKLAKKLGPKITDFAKGFSKGVITTAIGTPILIDVGGRVIEAETPVEKGKEIGEVVAELSVFGVGTKIGSRIASFTVEPIKIRTPTRKVKTPEFEEISVEAIKGGEIKQLSTFEIFGEKRPPILEETTTALRRRLGRKPISKRIIPAQEFNIKTLEAVIGEEPFVVSEVVKGKRKAKITTIEGESKGFSTEEIDTLSALEEFTLKRQIQRKTGRPVSRKTAKILLGKEAELTKSAIISEDVLKARVVKGALEVDLIPRGKRVRRSIAISKQKLIGETDKLEIFAVETEFKDITKPFARRAGKTTRLKGRLIAVKEPVLLDRREQIGFRPFGIKKTPLRKSFEDEVSDINLKQVRVQRPSPIAKPLIPRVVTPTKTVIRPRTQQRTVEDLALRLGRDLGLTRPVTRVVTKEALALRGSLKEKSILKEALKEKLGLKEKLALKQSLRVTQKQRSKLALKLSLKPLLKQKTKARVAAFPKIKTVSKFKPLLPLRLKGARRKLVSDDGGFRDALFFTPGFTERVLGVTRIVTRKQLAKEVRTGGFALRGRAIPIFIPQKKRKGSKLRVGID